MSGRPCVTTAEENLAMIQDHGQPSAARGTARCSLQDAEHFFRRVPPTDPAYALEVVRVATEAGADVVALCDTNGGMLPGELGDVVTAVAATGARLGIHCHDDTACAVANSLVAVDAGVTHVQGCANGYGERAGNANLFSVVAGLQLKKGQVVLPEGCLAEMSRVSHAISEVTNVTPSTHQPYVGFSAFAHKAGLHASAVKVDPMLYQHIDPALVGNDMRMLVSDMAGRASVEIKGKQLGYDLSGDKPTVGRVVNRVKELEARGYTFEAADASFELLLRDELAGESGSVTSRSNRGGSSWSAQPAGRWSARPPSNCTPWASGSSPPGRATARSTRWTGRCGSAWSGSTPELGHAGTGGLQRSASWKELAWDRRGHAGAHRVQRRHGARPRLPAPGARWVWTRTSSPRPGTPWRKR